MFHVLPYTALALQQATYQNLLGIADSEFSRRGTNNNFMFSEDYSLLCAYILETAPLGCRIDMPTLNCIGRHHIHPLNAGVVVPSRPYQQDLRDYPLKLPKFEELGVQVINGTAGTEQSTVLLTIAPPTWKRNLPRGEVRLTIHGTVTVTGIANTWSLPAGITFDENLRQGWYALVGAQAMFANLQCMRFIFARPYIYSGRKLRPGIIGQNAIGDFPADWQMGGLGVFGVFHTFEPPQVEILSVTAGAKTPEVFLDVVYLGEGGGAMGAPPVI